MQGLEEKRISYVVKSKDPARIKKVSEYSALNELYGKKFRTMLEEIKTKCNEMTTLEIELRNSGEPKAAEIINSVRQKLTSSRSHLMEAINTLV